MEHTDGADWKTVSSTVVFVVGARRNDAHAVLNGESGGSSCFSVEESSKGESPTGWRGQCTEREGPGIAGGTREELILRQERGSTATQWC